MVVYIHGARVNLKFLKVNEKLSLFFKWIVSNNCFLKPLDTLKRAMKQFYLKGLIFTIY